MQEIIITLKKYIPLSAEDEIVLGNYLTERKLKKKEFLFRAGEPCTANHFVVKGCLRLYIINAKGVEQMIQFGIDNWWISDYMALSTKKPSEFYLQAVEDTEVILLEAAVQNELFEKIPQFEKYFRMVLERAYAASQMRIHYIFNFGGEERYRHFTAMFPGFVQRVPQYLLASYLGVTPEFLSKVRAKKE
jgi:CRP-like cAMP-binding protein